MKTMLISNVLVALTVLFVSCASCLSYADSVQINQVAKSVDRSLINSERINMIPLLTGEMAQKIIAAAALEAKKDKLAVCITVVT